ncbi:uncharacterized protein LOC131235167 [Magnolia sinica]|uniref:uncharacterized protein LOC131235167 n=1 Tax=Magnolia sinica TaxID=86752 RepID=UPI00265B6F1A|nr:uncharacterized protein LOC131235167 [Magnolia sinica]
MAETRHPKKPPNKNHQNKKDPRKPAKKSHHPPKPEKPPSWAVVRSLLTCKDLQETDPIEQKSMKKYRKMGCSVSLCSLREHSRVMHRPEASSSPPLLACNGNSSSRRSLKAPLNESNGALSSSTSNASSSVGGSFRGMHLRRLSGCYECHMVMDPSNGVVGVPSAVRACPDCGEVFTKSESLEVHQAVRHAVSELGPEDSSRNIVEIIFQSSWLKKQAPVCKIERILKVHNSQKTITRFEDYRDSIKVKANKLPKKHPRCVADGNELLRFHCTTFACSIGTNGSSNLCDSIPNCNVCSIIRNGFKVDGNGGICTTATSGKAHDHVQISSEDEKRAMLVCRVIAGRVKKNQDAAEDFDSVGGPTGIYSNLDELIVFNPKAILPCFVVIYTGF